jgi:anti-sigma B factor antagonist
MDMNEKADLEIIGQGKVAIVVFKATSISNAEAIATLSKQIKKFIDENHPENVIFDFGQVKFFSSQVLGVLLDIRAKMEKDAGQVVISAIEPQLHRVFKITNLDKIFRFFPDKEIAIQALTS